MADFGLLSVFVRELTSLNGQTRGSPPTKSLADTTISEALAKGGSVDGRYAAGYLYHTARMSQTIVGAKRCLDLGAAPGCQLLQLAPLHPTTQFVGVDRSETLLADARAQMEHLNVSNVEWLNDDITSLSEIDTCSVDAVISTMTLHDLEGLESVYACLRAVDRVLRPGGAIYIEDYARLKSARSIAYFNAVNGQDRVDAFTELNDHSLKAAFEISELKMAFAQIIPTARIYSTFLIPFLNVAKTPDRELPAELSRRIKKMRMTLCPKKRADLDDLRTFFRLGGWKNDPFD